MENVWREKVDAELESAARNLGDYTEQTKDVIRAELRRRGLPEPAGQVPVSASSHRAPVSNRLRPLGLILGVVAILGGAAALMELHAFNKEAVAMSPEWLLAKGRALIQEGQASPSGLLTSAPDFETLRRTNEPIIINAAREYYFGLNRDRALRNGVLAFLTLLFAMGTYGGRRWALWLGLLFAVLSSVQTLAIALVLLR